MKATILGFDEAAEVAERHNAHGIRTALCTGVFDILHVGHLRVFDEAQRRGPVFVGVNTCKAVRMLKGPTRPINKLEDRMAMLVELRSVNFVFPVPYTTVGPALQIIKPSWWLKGASYTMDTLDKGEVEIAKAVGAEIVLVPMVEGMSTTAILASGVTKK